MVERQSNPNAGPKGRPKKKKVRVVIKPINKLLLTGSLVVLALGAGLEIHRLLQPNYTAQTKQLNAQIKVTNQQIAAVKSQNKKTDAQTSAKDAKNGVVSANDKAKDLVANLQKAVVAQGDGQTISNQNDYDTAMKAIKTGDSNSLRIGVQAFRGGNHQLSYYVSSTTKGKDVQVMVVGTGKQIASGGANPSDKAVNVYETYAYNLDSDEFSLRSVVTGNQ